MNQVKRISDLACYLLLASSIVLAVGFDLSVHQSQVIRYHGEVPGDFLTFRTYAILAIHPLAKIHAAVDFLYPPPFLLFIGPLFWFSPLPGYLLWVGSSNLFLVLIARSIRLPWKAICFGLISAPNLFCALTGQSGILVSALVLGAVGLAETQPVLAGFAAGLVIVKPQFGLLLPVCFLAQRNWRAIAAAGVMILCLCLLTSLIFGGNIWHGALAKHAGSSWNMLDAAWPAEFQIMMVTPFITFRSLYASLTAAAIAQTVVSFLSAAACWHLWRRNLPVIGRIAPTMFLVMLATPYGYIYDLPALGMVLAAFAMVSGRGLAALTLFSAFTSLYALLSVYWFSTGALFLAIIAVLTWPRPASQNFITGDRKDRLPRRFAFHRDPWRVARSDRRDIADRP